MCLLVILFCYSLGILDGLSYNGYLTSDTPIAGASAGAIATATHACNMDTKLILDDVIDISKTCQDLGSARGNLLPLLRQKLEHRINEEQFQAYQNRPGEAVISHHELFPTFGPKHETEFSHKEEFIDAVCHSSSFPFFASNWPVSLDYKRGVTKTTMAFGGKKLSLQIPRVVVDGYFAVPLDQFGCPDFELANVPVDRSISITCFPREAINLDKSIAEEDCICPELIDEGIRQSADLLTKATQPSEASDIIALYDAGFADAERWCRNEVRREREEASKIREAARREEKKDKNSWFSWGKK